MVKAEWFKYYGEKDRPESFDRIVQSWDTANKATELSDFSVCTGSVSTCASWRIPVVMEYAAARFRGMKRDAVPGMSINGRQASV